MPDSAVSVSRLRRAMLFVPANSEKMLRKAVQFDVDCLIFDLEDSVAPHEKADARQRLADLLPQLDFGATERLVRINGISDDDSAWQEDVRAMIGIADGIVIPKVDTPAALARVAEQINRAGVNPAAKSLHALIESAKGLLNLKQILAQPPLLTSIILGGEDLAYDLHMPSTHNAYYLDFARFDLLVHARAYGVQAIDSVFANLSASEEALTESAAHARQFGFDGKLAIHPKQIAPLQQAFAPTPAEVDYARRVIAASEDQDAAFRFEGQMIDRPILLRAAAVVEYANRLT